MYEGGAGRVKEPEHTAETARRLKDLSSLHSPPESSAHNTIVLCVKRNYAPIKGVLAGVLVVLRRQIKHVYRRIRPLALYT